MEPVKTWHDYLDNDAPLTEESVWQAVADANGVDYSQVDAPLTEESVWQAIADANGVDYSQVADGDLAEWL